MTEPEIARRCHACGASIRDQAAFCPQCGENLESMTDDESGSGGVTASTIVETTPLQANSVPETQAKVENPGRGASAPSPKLAGSNLAQPKRASSPPSSRPDKKPAAKPGAQIVGEARGKMKRATGIAKNVGGDVVQRGQKLREMSSVVLDEASYDPSLRFVLVAAALFFLFLIIILLNRFIT